MTCKINADTSDGLKIVSDTSGVIEFQNNGTTIITSQQPAFSAHGPAQSIGNASWTKLTFDTEEFDTDGKFASDRFTPTVAGYYQISGGLYFGATSGACVINIYKNGSGYKRGAQGTGVTGFGMATGVSALIYLDADDYVELYGNVNTSASNPFFEGINSNVYQSTFGGYKIVT